LFGPTFASGEHIWPKFHLRKFPGAFHAETTQANYTTLHFAQKNDRCKSGRGRLDQKEDRS
jgi:hypothetical protein